MTNEMAKSEEQILTLRELQILDFIKAYHQEHQWAPSVREVARGVGLKTSSVTHGYLKSLAEKGRIVYQGVRQIRVL